MRFTDRTDAGQRLAARLRHLRGENVVVLGLPRGGVPVAFEVAQALHAPLDVIMVRKLGVPYQPELAMGAIGEGGVRVTNDDVILRAGVTEQEIAQVEERERAELDHQAARFRAGRAGVDLAGRTAILVDDGIATGSTARAACEVARRLGAAKVVLAVPVGAPESVEALGAVCDEVVCLEQPMFFMAVGTWYRDFGGVPDAEVSALLRQAGGSKGTTPAFPTRPSASSSQPRRDELVQIPAGGVTLAGQLVVPPHAPGLVVFVHGSGSSRHSPRNREVAADLAEAGLGTLLFDLLTADEERDRANVFNVQVLAARLIDVTAWLRAQPGGPDRLPLGYFGASTGAAAALWAAAEPGSDVAAIVSRGGRPDLAAQRLPDVRSPTLLIVGERDAAVLGMNRDALALLRCEADLVVVPGASHLFPEPGAMAEVTRLATDWFAGHLGELGRHTE